MLKQEDHHNTPTQVEEYLRAALLLTEALDVPDDLRVAFFQQAVALTSAKQIMYAQPQSLPPILDGRPLR